jgi:hypothetical protein
MFSGSIGPAAKAAGSATPLRSTPYKHHHAQANGSQTKDNSKIVALEEAFLASDELADILYSRIMLPYDDQALTMMMTVYKLFGLQEEECARHVDDQEGCKP